LISIILLGTNTLLAQDEIKEVVEVVDIVLDIAGQYSCKMIEITP